MPLIPLLLSTSSSSTNITATGIPSAQAFGTATITPGPVNIAPTGIPSAEAFGRAVVSLSSGTTATGSNRQIKIHNGGIVGC